MGGGSQNALLNRFAADATQRQVIAGPVEATAIGNVLIQAVALGHVESLAALRQIVRDSFILQTFEPNAPRVGSRLPKIHSSYPPDMKSNVKLLWDDAAASELDPVERLVYRSTSWAAICASRTPAAGIPGQDYRQDPLTGAKVEVLWVKGSGGDLRTSRQEFCVRCIKKSIDLQRLYASEPRKGPRPRPKTRWSGCTRMRPLNLNPRASSHRHCCCIRSFRCAHQSHAPESLAISVAAARIGAVD